LQLYALEGFLDRLSTSAEAKRLVLKGGVLLAAYDTRRPTRDVDLSAEGMNNNPESARQAIARILTQRRDDGFVYADPTAEPIRDADAYSGVRVTVPCTIASAKISFHVDINFGDPILPPAETVSIPRLLGGSIEVRGYPLSMILAEKIVTAVQRGTANTRWRDFVDIHSLSNRQDVDSDELAVSLAAVAEFTRTSSITVSRYDTGRRRLLGCPRRLEASEHAPPSLYAAYIRSTWRRLTASCCATLRDLSLRRAPFRDALHLRSALQFHRVHRYQCRFHVGPAGTPNPDISTWQKPDIYILVLQL
jgi:predicted nucleotidyltransferase component of viral defense system